jgi:hypothetical protein
MPLQATSGAASYDAFGGGVAAVPNYIEEVFGNYLYTGNGSTQTITNGIDLSTKGGLTWLKQRNDSVGHRLYDTARGATKLLESNGTAAQSTSSTGLTAFTSSGFSLGNDPDSNTNNGTYASWTFRKAPKFFDVVTYTGNGVDARAISHSLGATPGCIIIKKTSDVGNWVVGHRSLNSGTGNGSLFLNTTDAYDNSGSFYFGNRGTGTYIAPTSTQFTVSYSADVNASGQTYVAYLFAHDAGGFGLTGTDNVISCGSTTMGAGITTTTLGYETQWLLIKGSNNANAWWLVDNMRGLSQTGYNRLIPNDSSAETAITSPYISITSTGFTMDGSIFGSGNTFIYIAIRRGPMKVPTSGTSVFNVQTASSASSGTVLTTNMNTDMIIGKNRNGNYWAWGTNKLTGFKETGVSNNTEWRTSASGTYISAWGNRTVTLGTEGDMTGAGEPVVWYSMTRAPSFVDVVCYKGNGSTQNINHNLNVVPELIICKQRTSSGAWAVYSATAGNSSLLQLESTGAVQTGAPQWNSTTPTASVFSLGTSSSANASGVNYVSFLFASCPGVSKVGSYIGNGSSQTINCGFTGGARFVMIKSITQGYSQSKWYVWDTARGLVSGNDPYLMFNESSGEATGLDAIDPDSSGFIVNQVGDAYNPTDTNASGQTYIYLAIA